METRRNETRGVETRGEARRGEERRRRREAAAHLATAHADSQPRARLATDSQLPSPHLSRLDLSSGHDSPISPRISPTYTTPLLAAQNEGAAHGSGAERVAQHTRDTPLGRRLMKRRLGPYPSRKV